MSPFRSEEMNAQYRAWKESGGLERSCILCDRPAIRAFTHWKIIPNHFPYDMIAETHHMIVPLRHVQEHDLTEDERAEYTAIKSGILQEYDFVAEATYKRKSIPAHFHIHLIVAKERNEA